MRQCQVDWAGLAYADPVKTEGRIGEAGSGCGLELGFEKGEQPLFSKPAGRLAWIWIHPVMVRHTHNQYLVWCLNKPPAKTSAPRWIRGAVNCPLTPFRGNGSSLDPIRTRALGWWVFLFLAQQPPRSGGLCWGIGIGWGLQMSQCCDWAAVCG